MRAEPTAPRGFRPAAGPTFRRRALPPAAPCARPERPSETQWALDLDFVRGVRRHGDRVRGS